ncbi:hypothetical protein [Methylobrevis pamukkalensis]|uniref:Uncharacterized protein n=1 Tax=Methylobrevis pamukkalensis TaxID=1439726 RepID=A0A1E3H3Q3_9HYPH|nr:hypothetical protein [Methylobrevis pamukkalensis]ODN70948.1 hypothetical protein A6302_01720 [Methylobrevis pamukkalensis]
MATLSEDHETDHEACDAERFKRRAMQHIEQAFDEADADGVPADAFAHVALFTALTTLVDCFGEPVVAAMISKIPAKIAAGDYTLDRTLQ